jgi:lamin B
MSTNGAAQQINTRSSQSRESSSSSNAAAASNTSASNKTPFNQNTRDFFCRSSTADRSLNGTNGAANSRRSPVSPSRITRLQEKEEMQNLNDRLVIYIETVRRLEAENFRLKSEVQSYTEVSTRDVTEIKVLYEKELEDAKRLIDELARDKAKFEIELNKHKALAQENLDKYERRDREFQNASTRLLTIESELLEYKRRSELAQNELQRKNDELKQLKPQVAELEKQLVKLKKQLEDETLARVDLENKNTTLKEDLNFKSQIYDKETDQLRSSKRVEIEQVDCRLRDEYDTKLMHELQLIRDEAENKIREMKDEVERRYQNKFYESDSSVKRAQQTISTLRDELASMHSKCDEQSLDLRQQLTKISSMETRIKELEEKLKKNAAKYEQDMADKDKELDAARKELGTLMLDYQELYDIKIGLDMEIEAYRKLLESEEKRLNISNYSMNLQNSYLNESSVLPPALSSTTTVAAAASTRGAKKRKVNVVDDEINAVAALGNTSTYEQSAESKNGIELCEHDFEGKSVKLTNTTDKDISMGGWQLRRTADNNETDYKFAKSFQLKAGQSVIIWSSNATPAAGSPDSTDIIMNGKQWCTGAKIITVLFDKEGNVIIHFDFNYY